MFMVIRVDYNGGLKSLLKRLVCTLSLTLGDLDSNNLLFIKKAQSTYNLHSKA